MALIIGSAASETLVGTSTDDIIQGLGGNDLIGGRNGDDVIDGGAGDDFVGGENGNDSIDGGVGADRLFGDAGDDELLGFDGDDGLFGGAGNDLLFGENGNDFLDGGAGDDDLGGGFGNDTVLGGAGNDFYEYFAGEDGADRVDLGTGDDGVLVFGAGQVRLSFVSAEVGNGNERGTAGDTDLAVRLQSETPAGALTGDIARFDDEGITFVAAPGLTFDVRDFVSGAERGNMFTVVSLGTSGNDNFAATPATPGLTPQPIYINAGAGNDTVAGGAGNDFLVGGAGNDLIGGGDGADRLFGQAGDDFMGGEAGDDALEGGIGVDVLFGDAGNDILIGGAENDRLFGGDGDDRMDGSAGNDELDGGAGTDTAFFTGARSAYTITTTGRVTTITGADGTDRLIGVERFQFSDQVVTIVPASGSVSDDVDLAPISVDAEGPSLMPVNSDLGFATVPTPLDFLI